MYMKPTMALWEKVKSKIEGMYKDRVLYAQNWYNYGLDKKEFEWRCMQSIVTPEEDKLIHELGDKWFTVADTVGVRISFGGPGKDDYDTYNLPANIGGRKKYVSPHWNDYHAQSKPIVRDPSIVDIAVRRRAALARIVAERVAFTDGVKKAWDDAPSLNSLVKVWPPVVDLLPADVIQKLETKTTRRTTKELAEEVDTKSLSVHILKAKVAQ